MDDSNSRTTAPEHTPASLRAVRGWSREQLAEAADVALHQVRAYDAGGKVSLPSVAAIARALGVSLEVAVRAWAIAHEGGR